MGQATFSDSVEKPTVRSFEGLRTNGGAVEIIGVISVHAEPVEAFLGFFNRVFFFD